MDGFKFNFSTFGKPKVKSSGSLPRREVIQQNVIGVIGIDINGNYYVDIKNSNYPLTIESYDLKGKNVYYSRTLQNRKTLEIISLSKRSRNNKQYLPFAVGSIVTGTIYKILNTERFNIRRVLELSEIPDVEYNYYKSKIHKHKQFFRDNYDEIIKCII